MAVDLLAQPPEALELVIVLILVLVWAAALLPIALRKRSEWELSSSIAQFHQGRRALDRFAPAPGGRSEAAADDPREQARAERAARARHKLRQERRRRTLGTLVVTFFASLVFGAIPALRPLWYLALVSGLCAVTYVGLLVYFRRMEELALERERKVVELAALARKGAVVPIRPRPSFVIVEATS